MADGPVRRDSGQIAASMGVPVHLVDECQVEILRGCPESTPEQTRDVRKALRRLQLASYDAGKQRGSDEAAFRLRELLKDVGPAWAQAVRELQGLAEYQMPTPTVRAVADALRSRSRRVVASDGEVRQLLRVMSLPFVCEGDDPPEAA